MTPSFRSLSLATVILAAYCQHCGPGVTPAVDAAMDSQSPTDASVSDVPAGALALTSTAFPDGGVIPARYATVGCGVGAIDVSPPLSIRGVPAAARSLVLIVDDPDAPGGTFTHWLLWDIPTLTMEIAEGLSPAPPGAQQGTNGFGNTAWGGPCPPNGEHRYYFRLYAVDLGSLGLSATAGSSAVQATIQGHVVAQAEYMGRYAQ